MIAEATSGVDAGALAFGVAALRGVGFSGSAVRGVDFRGAAGSGIAWSWVVERDVASPGVFLLGVFLLGVFLLGVVLLGVVARVGVARLRGVGVIPVGSEVTGVASGMAGAGGGGVGATAAVLVAVFCGRGAHALGGRTVGSPDAPGGASSLAG
ncbi:hypothetical protein ACLQ24_13675 [Micromonospora sp. DT4]|uniref:hypothetical protein n=1 Tax=Micromonospora sp. DT4 TaxID=3393438 RepID=UPI003CEDAA76